MKKHLFLLGLASLVVLVGQTTDAAASLPNFTQLAKNNSKAADRSCRESNIKNLRIANAHPNKCLTHNNTLDKP